MTAGIFPSSAVGRERLAPVVEAAAIRLTRLTAAGQPDSAIPSFNVTVAELPPAQLIDRCQPSDVPEGALLAGREQTADGGQLITLYARPLLLWADGTDAALTRLVRQALVDQLARAVGVEASELDPEAD